MKELEVTVTLRNNRLKSRRRLLDMTQAQVADAVGLALGTYSALETMRESPLNAKGQWRTAAKQIAEFHLVDPSELWPDTMLAVKATTAVLLLDADEAFPGLGEYSEGLNALPSATLERTEMRDAVERSLADLDPREMAVLRARFGIGGDEPMTQREIGDMRGVSGGRTGQIEMHGLRKLRRARRLKPWMDEAR